MVRHECTIWSIIIHSYLIYFLGWPLDQPRATFGTITGFWGLIPKVTRPILDENVRRGWESVISGLPDWTGLEVSVDSQHYRPGVKPGSIESYSQSQNIRNGVVQTNVTWRPVAGKPKVLNLNYTVVAHRKRHNLGLVRLDIASSEDTTVTIKDILDGAGATRSVPHTQGVSEHNNIMWTSVRPTGVAGVVAYITSKISSLGDVQVESSVDDATISREWFVPLKADKPVTIIKYVGIASSESSEDPWVAATQASLLSYHQKWEDLIDEHNKAWDEVWSATDIIIPGNGHLTKVARSSLFHLLANTRAGFNTSLTVGGLSSDSYAGLVFWDAETWMFPALLLFNPDHAVNIIHYRRGLLKQAVQNAQFYNYSGALYPWTSARYGNCTGTGLCQHYQYHLNSDIALSAWQYFQHTNKTSWLREVGWPLIHQVADMFAAFVRRNDSRGGMYETIRMGEPVSVTSSQFRTPTKYFQDEYVWNVNNGAFTNSGIKQLLGKWAIEAAHAIGLMPSSNWTTIAENLVIPYDTEEGLVHEFDNMPGTLKIKQASVALLNYPLDYRISPQQAENDLEYYGAVTDPNGPQMTWSIFAISSAQLQKSGCAAYTYLIQSYEPYLRNPFCQFSEQVEDDPRRNGGTSPAFPFLTGHGGFLQVLTHGLAGFRSHHDAFMLDPMLPPQMLDGVQLRGLRWQDAVFDVDIKANVTTITRMAGGPDKPMIVRIGGVNTPWREYKVQQEESIMVSTRRPDLEPPVNTGNQVQCAPITSTSAHTPGHGPIAAVDGSPATVWQPVNPQEPAELVVRMPQKPDVRGVFINWGNAPAIRFSVAIAQEDENETRTIYESGQVTISAPYLGPEDARQVKLRTGNSTKVWFEEAYPKVHSFKLVIEGTQGINQGAGATVAELAVL